MVKQTSKVYEWFVPILFFVHCFSAHESKSTAWDFTFLTLGEVVPASTSSGPLQTRTFLITKICVKKCLFPSPPAIFFQFIHSYLRKDARYLKPKFFRSSVAYSRSTCWIMSQTVIKKFQRLTISVCVFDPKGWVDVKRNILVTESHILRHLKWKGTGGGSLGEQGPGRAGSGSSNYKDTRLLFIKAKHPVKTQ